MSSEESFSEKSNASRAAELLSEEPAERIPLTKGFFATVDASDFYWLSTWKWRAHCRRGCWYAVRIGDGKTMHELICGQKGWDHKDRDGFNNRRSNLRQCSHAQNCINQKRRVDNSSGFKGVGWHKQRNLWRARLRQQDLGHFKTAEEAARAYDTAALKAFGDFAVLNFPL